MRLEVCGCQARAQYRFPQDAGSRSTGQVAPEPSPSILRPDFLWSLLALANFMRLSLMKAAHAVMSGAAYRKSGVWDGIHISAARPGIAPLRPLRGAAQDFCQPLCRPLLH